MRWILLLLLGVVCFGCGNPATETSEEEVSRTVEWKHILTSVKKTENIIEDHGDRLVDLETRIKSVEKISVQTIAEHKEEKGGAIKTAFQENIEDDDAETGPEPPTQSSDVYTSNDVIKSMLEQQTETLTELIERNACKCEKEVTASAAEPFRSEDSPIKIENFLVIKYGNEECSACKVYPTDQLLIECCDFTLSDKHAKELGFDRLPALDLLYGSTIVREYRNGELPTAINEDVIEFIRKCKVEPDPNIKQVLRNSESGEKENAVKNLQQNKTELSGRRLPSLSSGYVVELYRDNSEASQTLAEELLQVSGLSLRQLWRKPPTGSSELPYLVLKNGDKWVTAFPGGTSIKRLNEWMTRSYSVKPIPLISIPVRRVVVPPQIRVASILPRSRQATINGVTPTNPEYVRRHLSQEHSQNYSSLMGLNIDQLNTLHTRLHGWN